MTEEQELRAWSLEIAAVLLQEKSRKLDNDLFNLAAKVGEYIRDGKTPPKGKSLTEMEW
jgi:hypothetical protein